MGPEIALHLDSLTPSSVRLEKDEIKGLGVFGGPVSGRQIQERFGVSGQ